jgi:hypothetical protein
MANVLASVDQYEIEVQAERALAGLAVDTVKRLRSEGMNLTRIARAVALSRPSLAATRDEARQRRWPTIDSNCQ